MKYFLCIWNEQYYYSENNVEYKTIDFFNVEKGYDKEEIEIINKMDIGETCTLYNDHIIVRLKDI